MTNILSSHSHMESKIKGGIIRVKDIIGIPGAGGRIRERRLGEVIDGLGKGNYDLLYPDYNYKKVRNSGFLLQNMMTIDTVNDLHIYF